MSLNIKFSYLAKNSKFSRSNSYFAILTPTFLRDGFLNSYFQNPSENSEIHVFHDKSHNLWGSNARSWPSEINASAYVAFLVFFFGTMLVGLKIKASKIS